MQTKPQNLPPRPNKVIKTTYRNLIVIFSILAICLVATILYFALSQATIFITPNYTEQNVGFVVQVVDQDSYDIKNLDDQKIPGKILETTIDAGQEFPAEEITITNNKALGKLTVYNDYSQPQPLITRTRFESPDGKIFRLLRGVTIPANSSVEVEVEAEVTGEAYEVPASDFILPALSEWRRQYVYAKSTESMKRETTTQFQITQKYIDQTVNDYENQLKLTAKAELEKQISAKQTILEDSIETEVIKYSVSETAGSAKQNFTVTLALAVKAIAINETELKKQAVKSLPENYTQNSALTKVNNESFVFDVTFLDDNTENLLAQIKGEYSLLVANVEIDKAELKGLTKKEAETYLSNLSGVKKASVRMPFWTKFMPTLADHINVEIVK